MSEESSISKHSGLGVIALVIAAVLWSLNGPLIKLLAGAQGTGLSGYTIACYRSLLGGLLFLVPALRYRETFGRVSPAWLGASVITFTAMTVCFVVATTKTAAATAILLQYISPVVVFLLSPLLLNEKPRWSEGLVLLLAIAGVGIIFFGSPMAELGVLTLGLASGLGYGALTVVLRRLRQVHPTAVVALNFLGSGLLLLPIVVARGEWRLDGRQFALIAVMSIVQFSLPYAIFQWGLQRVEAHRAALIVLLEPVLNPILTWLIVGEPIPGPTLRGGPLILLSVLAWMGLTWRRERRVAGGA